MCCLVGSHFSILHSVPELKEFSLSKNENRKSVMSVCHTVTHDNGCSSSVLFPCMPFSFSMVSLWGYKLIFYQVWLSIERHQSDSINAPAHSQACFLFLELRYRLGAHTHNGDRIIGTCHGRELNPSSNGCMASALPLSYSILLWITKLHAI